MFSPFWGLQALTSATLQQMQQELERTQAQFDTVFRTLLGYSLGGTLTTIFSALYPQYVHNLAQLAALVNFHDEGLISQWMRKERFNVDLVVDTLGMLPAEHLAASFRMLKPTAQVAHSIALAKRLGDTPAVRDFLALQVWLNDMLTGRAASTRLWPQLADWLIARSEPEATPS